MQRSVMKFNRTKNCLKFKHLKFSFSTTASNNADLVGSVAGTRNAKLNNGNVDNLFGNKSATLKPFKDMPGPRGLPLVGTLMSYAKPGGLSFKKMFHVLDMRAKKYGPVYRETIGNLTSVIVSDMEEYMKIIRIDGKMPNRIELEPFKYFREQRNMDIGVVNSQGQEWFEKRQVLSPKLLNVSEILSHVGPVDEVTMEFIKRIDRKLLDRDGLFRNLERNLFMWALESVGTYLFDSRIGCMNEPIPPLADKFISNLSGMFVEMQGLMYGPPLYKYYSTPTWKRFVKYCEKVMEAGLTLIEEKQRQLAANPSLAQSSSSSFLTYLLNQQSMSANAVNLTSIDVMIGAIETTSNSISWLLYCLSRNPHIQQKLFEEVVQYLPSKDSHVTAEILPKMSYVKACLKETLRLYPITFATSRRIASEVEVGGYKVPNGMHVQANLWSIGRDEKLFPNSEDFIPDRWLRKTQDVNHLASALSNLPFGHGPRMCIGRRLAEMEIYTLISKLIRNFRVECVSQGEVEPILLTVLTPDRPLRLKFQAR